MFPMCVIETMIKFVSADTETGVDSTKNIITPKVIKKGMAIT